MNRRWKIIIPIGILVFPLVIYFFFRFGTTQHYNTLPIYGEKSVPPGGTDTLYSTLPEFSFTDQNGDPFTSDDLKGHIAVFNILSTSKPDAAKLLTQAMAIVGSYFDIKENDNLLIISLTADPDFDNPQTLKTFAEGMDANTDRWYFLTGNKAALYEFSNKGLGFECTAENKPFSENYTFRLVDREGRIRGKGYDGLNQKDMDKVIDDIVALTWEYNNQPQN